uniref:Uncharacterized protein n=1 Tax=Panagrolaimus davidi TaxID=227884 RepID=A0A914QGV2_9BILA
MGGIQQQANSIECVCRNSPCGYQPSFTPGQMVTFTPPEGSVSPANIPDSRCYYRHQVTCNDNKIRTMIRFTNIVGGMNSEDLPNPYDVFCPAGFTGYLYVSGDGQLKEAFELPPGAAIYCPP